MQSQNLPFVRHKFKKQQFKKHFHTSYSIGLIIDGAYKLDIENKQIVSKSGEIKVINPYELHIADGNVSWEYINFMPSSNFIKKLADEMCDNDNSCNIKFRTNIKDKIATNLYLRVFNSLKKNIEYEENLIIFISYLLENYASNEFKVKQIPANIKNSLEYIHINFLQNLTLDELAKISNVSKYHFIKTFKKEIGLTPHQYILDLKLEYAIKLIKQKTPLSQIAYICGFSDQSHFIKSFKKYFGFTPSALI